MKVYIKYTLKKILIILSGLFLIIMPGYLWITKKVSSYFLYGQNDHPWGEIATILTGIIIILVAIKEPKSNPPIPKSWYICPNCEETVEVIKGQTDLNCQKCGIKMEELEGFYQNQRE